MIVQAKGHIAGGAISLVVEFYFLQCTVFRHLVSQNLTIHLQRELRSDHAGETGAFYIYKGIVAVTQWRDDVEMLTFAKAHGATEADHLSQVEHWLPTTQRSLLLGPWRLAGWLTGALPALFGRRAVFGTIAAVETFVDHHYQ